MIASALRIFLMQSPGMDRLLTSFSCKTRAHLSFCFVEGFLCICSGAVRRSSCFDDFLNQEIDRIEKNAEVKKFNRTSPTSASISLDLNGLMRKGGFLR